MQVPILRGYINKLFNNLKLEFFKLFEFYGKKLKIFTFAYRHNIIIKIYYCVLWAKWFNLFFGSITWKYAIELTAPLFK